VGQLLRFTFPDGHSLTVEAADSLESGPAGAHTRVKDIPRNILEDLIELQRGVASTVRTMGSEERPQEFKVTLGVKFSAEAGAFIAKTAGEGSLTLEMTWKERESGGS